MGIKEGALALADELEGMDCREGCSTCPADGTKDCRGDLSCEEAVARATARRIREVVEHDACEDTTVSAYDLLPDEDRKAIAWVREQGGLETVKASAHQGAVEHGFLLKIAEMLGTSIYDGTDNADALLEKLSERLMPEGMEWPRFEDGEPVWFGDEASRLGEVFKVSGIGLYLDGSYALNFRAYSKDECVKRPAPKVVDADGVEIRAGDEVYIASCGDGPWTVTKITTAHAWHVYGHSDELGSLDMQPNLLTHRAPVLAADGKPLRVGETVYKLEDSRPYTVKRIDGDHVYINAGGKALDIWTFPGKLTHEQPDDWSRWREDLELSPVEYADRYRVGRFGHEELDTYRDLVRRAKKLAERGE